MTKEKIIDVFINNSDCPDGSHRTLNKYQQNKVVDELLTLTEQEKKEQVREILRDVKGKVELKYGYESLIYLRVCGIIDGLLKEYGVEL